MKEDTYSPAEAAKILRLSKRRIIQLATEGELEGEKDDGGRWRIPQRVVHERMPDRPPRPSERPPEAPQRLAELEAAEAPPRADLNYRLGAAETRTELTAQAESTVKEQLERERERADRLEEELRLERSKGFWRRQFGA